VYDGVDHPLWMWDRVADAGVYFELDCIGNVRRLRGGARYGAGAALASDLGGYRFTAFGRAVAADAGTPAPVVDGVSFAQPLRWQGRWLDTATGIYDVRNRQWAPELGAFLSADEFEFLGTSGTLWSWPGENPMKWRDLFGRDGVYTVEGGWDFGFLGGAEHASGTVSDYNTGTVATYESSNAAVGPFQGGGLTITGFGFYRGDLSAFTDAWGVRVQGMVVDVTINFAKGGWAGANFQFGIGTGTGVALTGGDTKVTEKLVLERKLDMAKDIMASANAIPVMSVPEPDKCE